MLNSMFEQIRELLGDKYALVKEFNPRDTRFVDILTKYDNLATLYINNGNLGFIPDGAQMTVYYTLELFMRVRAGVNTSDLITEPLNNLAKGMTGVLFNESGSVNYILDLGLPSSDGLLVDGIDGSKFIRYELPITAIISSGTVLSDVDGMTVTDKTTESVQTYPLVGVISKVFLINSETETDVFLNSQTLSVNGTNTTFAAGRAETVAVSSAWGYRITKYYQGDIVDKLIVSAASQPENWRNKLVFNGFELDNVTTDGYATFFDVQLVEERGQPSILTFSVAPSMRPVSA